MRSGASGGRAALRCGCARGPARLLAALVAGLAAACSPTVPPPGHGVVPVHAATAARRTVPVEVAAVGHVEPVQTVTVRAQIDGILDAVELREGQTVQEGDVLFTLDRRPFEAALAQARANQARDEAQARYADAQARRYRELFARGVASREQLDQYTTGAAAAGATVAADRAAVERARLDLAYCTIRAPFPGRTGSLSVHPGDVVKAHDTALVVIHQLQPILVTFSIPEAELPAVVAARQDHPALAVRVAPEGQRADERVGELVFIDNEVDRSTGTIQMKARFPNQDLALWPGEFVRTFLRLREQPDAVVVPSQAVQTGPQGAFVFVVERDQHVDMRAVTTGPSLGELVAIEKGVAAGEQVVTDGQLQLVAGAKVRVLEAEHPHGEPAS
jgi:multidrug efflux system membrane fusion protein